MPKKPSARAWLFATQWVHAREEDSGEGEVYRSADSDFPLSRQPREQLEFDQDGSARVFLPGPDDRLISRKATWKTQGRSIVIRANDDSTELRVVEASPNRLVVNRSRT